MFVLTQLRNHAGKRAQHFAQRGLPRYVIGTGLADFTGIQPTGIGVFAVFLIEA